ncbi:MAG: 50S ribosomal protein L34 [Ruthenibacterium sp.]
MKRTFQPKKVHRAKKCGFLARSKSANGRKVISSRRKKGRAKLAA